MHINFNIKNNNKNISIIVDWDVIVKIKSSMKSASYVASKLSVVMVVVLQTVSCCWRRNEMEAKRV